MTKTESKHLIFDKPERITVKTPFKRFKNFIKATLYKTAMYFSRPKRKETAPYKVSVCAIFKNEAKYLKEWLEYHKIVGVEHFFMYNNNSEDDYLNVLTPYIKDGTVTLIDWQKNQAQMEAYEDCIEKYALSTEWLGFLDIDEFVVPKKDNDVYSFLKNFSNRPAVMIYWKVFGTSGKIIRDERIPVTEDFTVCWNKYVNIGKCFFNTKYNFAKNAAEGLHHSFKTRIGGMTVPPVNLFDKVAFEDRHIVKTDDFPIQINHYFTKSFNEYVEKKSKGDVYFKVNPHDEEYFYIHEQKCGATDYCAYKYLIKLKKALEK